MKRALLVDDSKSARLIIKKLLEKQELEVEAVESGEIALENVKESRPDMIFIDFQMPGISGIETMQKIHAMPGCEGIPVVICTGNDEEGFLETAQGAGAVDVLTKPPSPKGLRAALEQIELYESSRPVAPPEPAPTAAPESVPQGGLSETAVEHLVQQRLTPALAEFEQRFQQQLESLRSQLGESLGDAGGNEQDTLDLIASAVGESIDPLQRELTEGLAQVREEFTARLDETREALQGAAGGDQEALESQVEALTGPRLAELQGQLEGRLQSLREDLERIAERLEQPQGLDAEAVRGLIEEGLTPRLEALSGELSAETEARTEALRQEFSALVEAAGADREEPAAMDEGRVRGLVEETLGPRIQAVSAETDDLIDGLRRDLDAIHQQIGPADAEDDATQDTLDETTMRVIVSEDLDSRMQALFAEVDARLEGLKQELAGAFGGVSEEAAEGEGEPQSQGLDREQATLLIQDVMEPRVWAISQEFDEKLAALRAEIPQGAESAAEGAGSAVDVTRLEALRGEIEDKLEALRAALPAATVRGVAPESPPLEVPDSLDQLLDERFEARDKAWQGRMEALRLHLLSIIDRYREGAGVERLPADELEAPGAAAPSSAADRQAIEAWVEQRLQELRVELGQSQPQIAEDDEPIELSELAEPEFGADGDVQQQLDQLSAATDERIQALRSELLEIVQQAPEVAEFSEPVDAEALRQEMDDRLGGLRAEIIQWVDERLEQRPAAEADVKFDSGDLAADGEEVAELDAESIEITGIFDPGEGEKGFESDVADEAWAELEPEESAIEERFIGDSPDGAESFDVDEAELAGETEFPDAAEIATQAIEGVAEEPSEAGPEEPPTGLRDELVRLLDERLEAQKAELAAQVENARLEMREQLEQAAPTAPESEPGDAPDMEQSLRALAADFTDQIDHQRQEILGLIGQMGGDEKGQDVEAAAGIDRESVEQMINHALEGLTPAGPSELDMETLRAEILEISRNEANRTADKTKKVIVEAVVNKLKEQSQQLNKRLERLIGDVKGHIAKQRTEIENAARDAATKAADAALAHASEFPENNITGIEDDLAALRDEFARKLYIFSGGAALLGILAGLLFSILL